MSCKKFVLTDCEDRTQLRHKKKHPQVTQSAETTLDNEGSFREGDGSLFWGYGSCFRGRPRGRKQDPSVGRFSEEVAHRLRLRYTPGGRRRDRRLYRPSRASHLFWPAVHVAVDSSRAVGIVCRHSFSAASSPDHRWPLRPLPPGIPPPLPKKPDRPPIAPG